MIDGFGTCLYGTEGQEQWFQKLYFDDMGCSILRFDLTPVFKAPYSDNLYNSPWYHGSPPLPGPDGNNVRTYTNASDYRRSFAGTQAKIAVMGPDIDANAAYFDFEDSRIKTAGLMGQVGKKKASALGDFKLGASLWSPPPWLKLSTGNAIKGTAAPLPTDNTPWPFIWNGNFAGGRSDTSNTPLREFDDSRLGGTGPTSALTQFARALAAFLRGFQNHYGLSLYAISIQNELNFEQYYHSCRYALSSDYIQALKAARAELDRYPDLKNIRLMGPEDLLGGDAYGMWQYGSRPTITHKNLQYLAAIAADPAAAKALDYFCVHGYANDGLTSSGADPRQWLWWVNGWRLSPHMSLPPFVKGFASYAKKSWMTETSGEESAWLSPVNGFPNQGAWSIALKIHQALTAGKQSAWLYWQMSNGKALNAETLTDRNSKEKSPKYVAAKHFFRYIRPNAQRVKVNVNGNNALHASAYLHPIDRTLTAILVNASPQAIVATVTVPHLPAKKPSFEAYTSHKTHLWRFSKLDVVDKKLFVDVPAYGVVTMVGR